MPDVMKPNPTLTIGLRWDKADLPVMRGVVQWLQGNGLGEAEILTILRSAVKATEAGTAMHVVCEQRIEVVMMQGQFSTWGFPTPVIEDVRQ